MSKSGRYIVLETDFSLRVSYDTDHSVEVKVPTTYFNLTCGMCGNFNNRRDDEYMMPNGQQAADSNALGESWQVPDSDPSCGVPVPSPPCSAEEEELYRSDQFCGILTTRPSSFERCHGVINPQDYFDTCLYDLCALNGGQEFLCAALEAYADACQAAGVTLLPWRNATFCREYLLCHCQKEKWATACALNVWPKRVFGLPLPTGLSVVEVLLVLIFPFPLQPCSVPPTATMTPARLPVLPPVLTNKPHRTAPSLVWRAAHVALASS